MMGSASVNNTHGLVSRGIRTPEGIKGRKARLKEGVSFHTSVSINGNKKRHFKAGTIVTGSYRMTNTDLFIFKFAGEFEFPLRPSKFEWID